MTQINLKEIRPTGQKIINSNEGTLSLLQLSNLLQDISNCVMPTVIKSESNGEVK